MTASPDPAPIALALSPHLDDAAFSCGGTLARLSASGWRVVVATLFTRSVASPTGFALACQLDKGLPASADYMALRRDEDAAACAVVGAYTRWFDFAEAPHRGYNSAAALFGPPLATDDIGTAVENAIAELLAGMMPSLVLAPQAIGGHVDHVVMVNALRACSRTTPLLWWRDFPYAARNAELAEPFGDAMRKLPERAVTIDILQKRAACGAYSTQLGYQFGGPEGLATALDAAGRTELFRVDAAPGQDRTLAAILEPAA